MKATTAHPKNFQAGKKTMTKQASVSNILQAFKNSTVQLESQEEEPVQKKSEDLSLQESGSLSGTLQLKTEVNHTSTDQEYIIKRGESDRGQQRMGVEMEALLDPEDPLHGTESGAFKRHGIYKNDDYMDNEDHATAMHLLNANLGGLAIDENLFPGTTNKNGQHLKSVETTVKNKVLKLTELSKVNNDYEDWRVKYNIKFSPPSVLTPDNWKDTPLEFYESYVDNNDEETNMMTLVTDHPNTLLGENKWTSDTTSSVSRKNQVHNDPNTRGELASFTEEISHSKDKSDSTRKHTHLSYEDYKKHRR